MKEKGHEDKNSACKAANYSNTIGLKGVKVFYDLKDLLSFLAIKLIIMIRSGHRCLQRRLSSCSFSAPVNTTYVRVQQLRGIQSSSQIVSCNLHGIYNGD